MICVTGTGYESSLGDHHPPGMGGAITRQSAGKTSTPWTDAESREHERNNYMPPITGNGLIFTILRFIRDQGMGSVEFFSVD